MTLYIDLRGNRDVGGVAAPAKLLRANGGPPYEPVPTAEAAREIAGADLVLAIHGFNVSRAGGAASLQKLETALDLPPNFRFFGVLWPGDYWLPVVNYTWEASDAVACGRYLAAFLDGPFARAASVSLVSHSLGGRVLLEAVQTLGRRARQVCITAGAVDGDCLGTGYARASGNAERTSVLSSEKDKVLRLAYPLGDFLSDTLLGDGDSPWRAALGLKGPRPPLGPPVRSQPIPRDPPYGHGDYFPPGKPATGAGAAKWEASVRYMRRALLGQDNYWG